MKLILEDKYQSLLPFEAELPDFALVTGLNGSGKSQLLTAIAGGAVRCRLSEGEEITGESHDIVKFDASDFGGDPLAGPKGDMMSFSAIANAVAIADEVFGPIRRKWLDFGAEKGWSEVELLEQTQRLASYGRARFDGALPGTLDQLLAELQREADELKPGWNPYRQVRRDWDRIPAEPQFIGGIPYFLQSGGDIEQFFLGSERLFQSSVSEIFVRYRNRRLLALLRQLADGDNEILRDRVEAQFVATHGPPPWVTFNETLDRLGLAARVMPPEPLDFGPYTPAMLTLDGETFPTQGLSGGERVILNLAMCGYQASTGLSLATPRVVLLDEVDAPLHPAMARTFLSVIKETLIDSFGIKVIATTHSPSTVALFPGEQVYVMRRGHAGPCELSKSEAVRTLTDGVPTLAVDIEDRRQVFAESTVEAKNLEALYMLCRPYLNSPISLQFIATGKERGAGKDITKQIVEDLSARGNKTVLGLLDWDRVNSSTDRIKVLAEGRRYALENIVLDPLVLAFAVSRLYPGIVAHVGLGQGDVLADLVKFDQAFCQAAVDGVTTRVLKKPPENRMLCTYIGGMTLSIDEAYLFHDAHKLEDAVVAAYTCFEKTARGGSGKLSELIIKSVLTGFPQLIPREVLEAFQSLTEA